MLKTIPTSCALTFAVVAHADAPEPLVEKFDRCPTRDQTMLYGAQLSRGEMGVMFDVDKDKVALFLTAWNANAYSFDLSADGTVTEAPTPLQPITQRFQ